SISTTFAAYPPQQSTSMRGVWVVTGNSITIRTQPNPSAPAITTQSTGNNEVDTVPNETGTWSGGYHYYQWDYTRSGAGSYSDSVSGYGAEGDTSNVFVTPASYVTNYTSTPDNIWYYSNLSGTAYATLAVGQKTYGAYKSDILASNDNPNAWLVSYSLTDFSDFGYVNGWWVNGTVY
ncbi:MAG: hypothetical protein ACXVP2_04435, partial [Tumebacillaceae bacterium]